MPGFRLQRLGINHDGATRWDLGALRRLLADAVQPAHFLVSPPLEAMWEHAGREEIPWELFHGRLLDRSQTREVHAFEAWNIYLVEAGERSGEPILAVKLDAGAGCIYVVRAIHCYAWEGYDAGNNVFLSRETQKWVRELVGQISVDRYTDLEALHDELICLLFHAIVGTSRLPLTSVEAPLPGFSLGQLAYFYRRNLSPEEPQAPLHSLEPLFNGTTWQELNDLERTKLLEASLRIPGMSRKRERRQPETTPLISLFLAAPASRPILDSLRRVFDEVALSPGTGFIDAALDFVRTLEENELASSADVVDFLGYLLRHVVRHLTAYDLITFHHQGANYPDALLLDAAMKAYFERIERAAELFISAPSDDALAMNRKRLRRRALRQAWLLRRFYEGLPVPDAPTSPGENARILPPPHVRVPEEQIFNPDKRTKRLFDGDSLPPYLGERSREVLQLSLRDLIHAAELRELGMALFLDRPLGIGKAPAAADQTLLISYEAFSRSIAQRRLKYLADDPGLLPASERDDLLAQLQALPVCGVPLPLTRGVARPGAVSLDDARKVAADFVFLRTTQRSLQELHSQFDFSEVERLLGRDVLNGQQRVLVIRDEDPNLLAIYDAEARLVCRLRVRTEQGYFHRGGREFPAAGLEAYLGTASVSVPVRLSCSDTIPP